MSKLVASPSLVQSQLVSTFSLTLPEAPTQQNIFVFGAALTMARSREVIIFINGTITEGNVTEASYPKSKFIKIRIFCGSVSRCMPADVLLRTFRSGPGSHDQPLLCQKEQKTFPNCSHVKRILKPCCLCLKGALVQRQAFFGSEQPASANPLYLQTAWSPWICFKFPCKTKAN